MTKKIVIYAEIEAVDEVPTEGEPPIGAVQVFNTGGEVQMGMIAVEDTSQDLTASVTFLDAHGHETTADDIPQWTSDNEEVATITQDDDGMSAAIHLTGEPGAAIISVDSTNEDGSTVHSQGTITVLPGDAVTGDVEFQAETPTGGDEASNEVPVEEVPPADETGSAPA